jgi:carbon storage regulator
MLVLSRKENEEIVVEDDIRIKLIGIRGNVVQLGIEAPQEVAIVRSELLPADGGLNCRPDQKHRKLRSATGK